MQTLRNLRRIIKEQLETAEYKALVEIHYDREFKVTEILDQVRALCGIVIVNSESTEKMTDRKEKVLTKIKFYALGTSTNEFIAIAMAPHVSTPHLIPHSDMKSDAPGRSSSIAQSVSPPRCPVVDKPLRL